MSSSSATDGENTEPQIARDFTVLEHDVADRRGTESAEADHHDVSTEVAKQPLIAWQERAAEHRKLTGTARDRHHRYYMLSGRLIYGAAAEQAVAEAVEVAKKLRAEDALDNQFAVFPRAPLPMEQRTRRERRIVPGDYVAVHADTMVGLAAALACIEAERHEAVAAHAELMAEFHAAIERAVEYRLRKPTP